MDTHWGGGGISSFVEAVEGLFDDSGIDLALQRTPNVFTDAAKTLFYSLEVDVKKVDSSLPPRALMDTKEMESIRRTASDLLALKILVANEIGP